MSSVHFNWLTGKFGNRNIRKKQTPRLGRRITPNLNGKCGGQTGEVFTGDIARCFRKGNKDMNGITWRTSRKQEGSHHQRRQGSKENTYNCWSMKKRSAAAHPASSEVGMFEV